MSYDSPRIGTVRDSQRDLWLDGQTKIFPNSGILRTRQGLLIQDGQIRYFQNTSTVRTSQGKSRKDGPEKYYNLIRHIYLCPFKENYDYYDYYKT